MIKLSCNIFGCYATTPPPPPRLLTLRGFETNPNFLLCLSMHMTFSDEGRFDNFLNEQGG